MSWPSCLKSAALLKTEVSSQLLEWSWKLYSVWTRKAYLEILTFIEMLTQGLTPCLKSAVRNSVISPFVPYSKCPSPSLIIIIIIIIMQKTKPKAFMPRSKTVKWRVCSQELVLVLKSLSCTVIISLLCRGLWEELVFHLSSTNHSKWNRVEDK